MSIEILTQNLHEQLFSSFRGCKSTIRIVSPFLSYETTKQLISEIEQHHLHCEVITRFSEDDFWQSASSIDAIERLLLANADVYAIKDIHTKLYLIDNTVAFVGSANFTNHGLHPSVELEQEMLIKIYDDSNTLAGFDQYFHAQKNPKAAVSLSMVNQSKANLANIPIPEKPKGKLHDYGYKKALKKPSNKKTNKSESKQRIWIKFEASDHDRADRTEEIKAVDKKTTNFSTPKKASRFSEGDILFIAKHSWDPNGKPMPIIVARANCHKFNLSQKVSEDIQWPYYLNLYNVTTIEGPVGSGIELRELIETLENDVYAHTTGDTRSIEDLMHIHRRQVSLELTETAKDYLNTRFELYNKD